MSLDHQRNDRDRNLEIARSNLKQGMVDFLEKARGKVPDNSWEQANATLGNIARAIKERDNGLFVNSSKEFRNLAGGPPFNNVPELFVLGDSIVPNAEEVWELKHGE